MFHKKIKVTLVEQKSEKKVYSARRNVKWLKYVILVALISFVAMMILANVKSKSYYQHRKPKPSDPKRISPAPLILPLDEISSRAVSCSTSYCSVTCTGDMTDLTTYLNNVKNCPSMSLTITDCTFPGDRLKSDWLKGSYTLSYINITRATLTEIDSGAFDQSTVASMTELKLNGVQLSALTENTFVGLQAVDTFTLVNKIEVFSGDGFLKPMAKKLKSVTIQHVTSTATDPTPWLRGEDFPNLMSLALRYSNFGGYITLDTFQHLKQLQILSLSYCKISYLPDGVFDFMIGHFGVYIFVDNNQLKRLAGGYLSKVKPSSLKYVQLENNPWDCNCELEELITEYTRYPGGFGSPAECSAPPQHAGKSLNEVVVESCADTTTALTTTTSTTTTTTTTSTTSTTTDPTTLSTLSSSSAADPSEPSTELPPHSTPSSTTTTVTTTASSTSITSDPTSSKSPGTTTGTPSPLPQTTTSPQSETTTMSADKIVSIECKRDSVDSSESAGHPVELARPYTRFNITVLNENSALMSMEETTDDLAAIWFSDQPVIDDTGGNVRIVGEFTIGCQSDLENSLRIEGLTQSQAYTFCLVKEGIPLIPPFNCLSHYTRGLFESEMWLKREDKVLIIGLLVVCIIFSVCIGVVGMFLTLRAYPTLLKGSKRVILVNRNTGDVLAKPRPRSMPDGATDSSYRNGFETTVTPQQRRSSETSIQSNQSYMKGTYYEDIDYYWRKNRTTAEDMTYANRIPKSPPPPLPRRVRTDISLTH